MKRTILSKIALALGVVAAALAGLGQGQAQANPSTFNVFTRCESNYIKVAGSHGMYERMVSGNPARVYFATYLMKYLPPNWVYTGRANTTWSRAAHDTERNVPYAVGPTQAPPVAAVRDHRARPLLRLGAVRLPQWERWLQLRVQGLAGLHDPGQRHVPPECGQGEQGQEGEGREARSPPDQASRRDPLSETT